MAGRTHLDELQVPGIWNDTDRICPEIPVSIIVYRCSYYLTKQDSRNLRRHEMQQLSQAAHDPPVPGDRPAG